MAKPYCLHIGPVLGYAGQQHTTPTPQPRRRTWNVTAIGINYAIAKNVTNHAPNTKGKKMDLA